MKINRFYHIMTLFIGLQSSFLMHAMINIPSDFKVTVKHDLSNLGEELTKASEGSTVGIVTGIAKAAQDPEFGQAIGTIFTEIAQQTSDKFAGSLEDAQ